VAVSTAWRDFDLTDRLAKIARAFEMADVVSANDVPILANTPCYFAFSTYDKPDDYFTSPASMVRYQEAGYQRHLSQIDDDVVPYFMPWFGTGVLASAFGCQVAIAQGAGNDPSVIAPCVTSTADALRLRVPDPHRDGWMPRVLAAIDHARANSDLPVGLTDMQGPLDTLGQMCGQVQLFTWMIDEPAMVHDMLDVVAAAFIDWVRVQKEHIGEPLDRSNGLQGVGASAIGVWESDDDMTMLSPEMYGQFVAPRVSRIFEAFGGGSIHFCGRGYQHLETILKAPGVRVVNTSPMGKFEDLGAFHRRLGGRISLQLQDIAPVDLEGYYRRLFGELDDLRGVIVAPFVVDGIGMDADGGYVTRRDDPFETAKRLVAVVRECIDLKLAGRALGDPPRSNAATI
jgi:uroporphyrinogen-III decarboxylase